jgi:hypothetical protein
MPDGSVGSNKRTNSVKASFAEASGSAWGKGRVRGVGQDQPRPSEKAVKPATVRKDQRTQTESLS